MFSFSAVNQHPDWKGPPPKTGDRDPRFVAQYTGQYNKALYAAVSGDREEAGRRFAAFLRLKLSDSVEEKRLKVAALRNYALLLQDSSYQSAMTHFLQATEIDSTDPGLWFHMGELARSHADYQLARMCYESCVLSTFHFPKSGFGKILELRLHELRPVQVRAVNRICQIIVPMGDLRAGRILSKLLQKDSRFEDAILPFMVRDAVDTASEALLSLDINHLQNFSYERCLQQLSYLDVPRYDNKLQVVTLRFSVLSWTAFFSCLMRQCQKSVSEWVQLSPPHELMQETKALKRKEPPTASGSESDIGEKSSKYMRISERRSAIAEGGSRKVDDLVSKQWREIDEIFEMPDDDCAIVLTCGDPLRPLNNVLPNAAGTTQTSLSGVLSSAQADSSGAPSALELVCFLEEISKPLFVVDILINICFSLSSWKPFTQWPKALRAQLQKLMRYLFQSTSPECLLDDIGNVRQRRTILLHALLLMSEQWSTECDRIYTYLLEAGLSDLSGEEAELWKWCSSRYQQHVIGNSERAKEIMRSCEGCRHLPRHLIKARLESLDHADVLARVKEDAFEVHPMEIWGLPRELRRRCFDEFFQRLAKSEGEVSDSRITFAIRKSNIIALKISDAVEELFADTLDSTRSAYDYLKMITREASQHPAWVLSDGPRQLVLSSMSLLCKLSAATAVQYKSLGSKGFGIAFLMNTLRELVVITWDLAVSILRGVDREQAYKCMVVGHDILGAQGLCHLCDGALLCHAVVDDFNGTPEFLRSFQCLYGLKLGDPEPLQVHTGTAHPRPLTRAAAYQAMSYLVPLLDARLKDGETLRTDSRETLERLWDKLSRNIPICTRTEAAVAEYLRSDALSPSQVALQNLPNDGTSSERRKTARFFRVYGQALLLQYRQQTKNRHSHQVLKINDNVAWALELVETGLKLWAVDPICWLTMGIALSCNAEEWLSWKALDHDGVQNQTGIANYQRKAMLCFVRVRHFVDQDHRISPFWTNWCWSTAANLIYSIHGRPMEGLALTSRNAKGWNEDLAVSLNEEGWVPLRYIDTKPNTRNENETRLNMYKIADTFTLRAINVDDSDWTLWFQRAKTLAKAKVHPGVVLGSYNMAIKLIPRSNVSRALEPRYKKLAFLKKAVENGNMTPCQVVKAISEPPRKEAGFPAIRSAVDEEYRVFEEPDPAVTRQDAIYAIYKALGDLKDGDRHKWHHRPVYLRAKISLREFDDFEQAKTALCGLFKFQAAKIVSNFYRTDAERAGKHFLYIQEYALLLVEAAARCRDRTILWNFASKVKAGWCHDSDRVAAAAKRAFLELVHEDCKRRKRSTSYLECWAELKTSVPAPSADTSMAGNGKTGSEGGDSPNPHHQQASVNNGGNPSDYIDPGQPGANARAKELLCDLERVAKLDPSNQELRQALLCCVADLGSAGIEDSIKTKVMRLGKGCGASLSRQASVVQPQTG